jgi:hypothetical protein
MHMKRIIFAGSIWLLLLWGCSEQSNEPGPQTPYEIWRSYNVRHYTVEQVRSCFCINGGVRMKVTVQADTVTSVLNLTDSTYLAYPALKQYLTIDSLFGIIRYSTGDSLVVSYDRQYGFPNTLDINPQQHPYDGGVLYETSNFSPLR